MRRMRCAPVTPSSFSRVCTPIAALAAMKRPGLPPRLDAESRPAKATILAPRQPSGTTNEAGFEMKSVRYSRYTGEDLGVSAEDLMRALADFFLQSGFDNPYMQFSEMNQRSLEDLKRAIEEALSRGEMFDPERA